MVVYCCLSHLWSFSGFSLQEFAAKEKLEIVNYRGGAAVPKTLSLPAPPLAARGWKQVRAIFNIHRSQYFLSERCGCLILDRLSDRESKQKVRPVRDSNFLFFYRLLFNCHDPFRGFYFWFEASHQFALFFISAFFEKVPPILLFSSRLLKAEFAGEAYRLAICKIEFCEKIRF